MPFTKAGFNAHHTTVARALVAAREHGIKPAELIRFTPGGDLAWYSKRGRFLVWAEQASVCPLIGPKHQRRVAADIYYHDRPCSRWPRDWRDKQAP